MVDGACKISSINQSINLSLVDVFRSKLCLVLVCGPFVGVLGGFIGALCVFFLLGRGLPRSPHGLFRGLWWLLCFPGGFHPRLINPSAQHLLSSSLRGCVLCRALDGPMVGAVAVVALLSSAFKGDKPECVLHFALFARPITFR